MTVMFWPVVIFMAISLAIGLYTYTQVRGSSKRFTVCGKSMPFIIVGTALMAQAVDGNATLGNASLTYASGIWAGRDDPTRTRRQSVHRRTVPRRSAQRDEPADAAGVLLSALRPSARSCSSPCSRSSASPS